MVCDVRDHALVEEQVARVEDELGPIEVAVHVAGVIQIGPLDSLTRQHFEEAIDTMQWGPINLALAVVPGMRARGRGRIGTIASIGGLVSVPHLLPYCTAKFGAVGFSTGLRAELAGTGVTATTVAPGLMRTGSHLRAEFTGDQPADYAWFAPGASLPLVSMDAERAAVRIVRGILRGRSVVILTPLAKVGARVEGVAPATTAAAMSVLARLLPDGPGRPTETVEGRVARRRLRSPLVERLTVWGNRAAARNNEEPA
jgi:NAD(P)-dependent dehydrogenase (short-subunit alcohol dehydrogenase family)